MRIRFLVPAEAEYLEALHYYNTESPELAAAFLEDLEHTLSLLQEHPEIGQKYDDDCRRLLFRRFRHSLIYETGDQEIVIVAVAHQRERPKSWKERR